MFFHTNAGESYILPSQLSLDAPIVWQYLKKRVKSTQRSMLEGTRSLFSAGSFEFQTRHLLVIAVLALAFTSALIMRFYPAKYGFYLNEFDPYFEYRATQYIVYNGLDAYWKWHDTMSWYP